MPKASSKQLKPALAAEYCGKVRIDIKTTAQGKSEVIFFNDREQEMTCKEAVTAILKTARWTAADLAERMRLKKRSIHNWTLGRSMSVGCALQLDRVLKEDIQFLAACDELERSSILLVDPPTPSAGRSKKPAKKGGK